MDKVYITADLVFLLTVAALVQSVISGCGALINCSVLIMLLLQGIHLYQLYQQRKFLQLLIHEKKRKEMAESYKWEEEEQDKLDMIKKRVELHTLQSQINPHFLYNTLDSIRSRALLDQQIEIATMTEILSKFFRYCISRSESLVKIREEINHIKDYYFIQKYRFEDRFDMEIEVEDETVYDYYIPKMTLQPLIENAMIHGLEKVARKGEIKLRIFMTEQKVILIVSDNGVGMNTEQLKNMNDRMKQMYIEGSKKGKHNSIAVSNVNARIRLIFGEDYGIHYHSLEDQGTDVIVRIPKIDDFSRNRYEDQLEGSY